LHKKFYRRLVLFLSVLILLVSGCHSKTKEELLKDGAELLKTNPNGAIVLFKDAVQKDPNFFEGRFYLAKAYVATGKYERADKELQKVLRQNPKNIDIHRELSKVYIYQNKPEDSMREAKLYLQSKPDDPEALALLGRGYALTDKYKDAKESFLRALQKDGHFVPAKLDLAALYKAQGDTEGARSLLKEVIRSDDQNIRAYYMLAQIEADAGNREEAIKAYKKIADINPSDANALFMLGLSYLEQGDIKKADKAAERMVKKMPRRPEGYRLKGLLSFREKKYDDAVVSFLKSIEIQPATGSYYYLGLCYYNTKVLEQALSAFQKTLDLNPSSMQARLMVAAVLLQQKRVDEAIEAGKKAVQLNEKSALAHNMLGSAYMAKGLYDEGMKELDRAIEIDPELVSAHLKKSYFDIAKGKSKEAEAELETVVQISPEVLNTRLLLIAYYMKAKEYDKALKTAKEGIVGKKSDAVLYSDMAIAVLAKNRNNGSEAFQYIKKAKEANPDFFVPYFNAASYYIANGQYEKALDEYKAVLARAPGNLTALLRTASILELRGRDVEARTYYSKATEVKQPGGWIALANYYLRKKDPEQAVRVLDQAIKTDPKDISALEMQGKIYFGQKKYTAALRDFEAIEKISPDRGVKLIVNTYLSMRQYDKAIGKLEAGLRAAPQRIDLLGEIALVNYVKGDSRKAVDCAQKIISQKPDSAYGYVVLASIYERQGELDRAIDTLKEGLQVEEGNLGGRMMLAKLYTKKQDYATARKIYENVLKTNQNYVPAIFGLGTLCDRTGKKKEAAEMYRQVLAKSANYVPALNNLALLYAEGNGNEKEALRLASEAYSLAPVNASIIDTLGYCLLKNGKVEEATKALEKAASLMPDNPSVRYHLALAYKRAGKNSQAREQIELALAKKNFPEVVQARKTLAELKVK
jgi:putative PEP-CTERM system TPR-repeat lipoprotein